MKSHGARRLILGAAMLGMIGTAFEAPEQDARKLPVSKPEKECRARDEATLKKAEEKRERRRLRDIEIMNRQKGK